MELEDAVKIVEKVDLKEDEVVGDSAAEIFEAVMSCAASSHQGKDLRGSIQELIQQHPMEVYKKQRAANVFRIVIIGLAKRILESDLELKQKTIDTLEVKKSVCEAADLDGCMHILKSFRDKIVKRAKTLLNVE
jgi:hypothetical protein